MPPQIETISVTNAYNIPIYVSLPILFRRSNELAGRNETELAPMNNTTPKNEPHYYNEIRRMDGGVSKPSESVYHTLDRDTVNKSMATPHTSVVPSMSKAEHAYHTLDHPKQSNHKHGMEVKGDTSLATHALAVPNTTKPEHVCHTLQNPNHGVKSDVDFLKEVINSQNGTSDTDPKYDEPMFPNRLPPQKITHSASEEVTRTKNKIVFDDLTYAVNPHESLTDTEAVPLAENHSRELEAVPTSNIRIKVSTSELEPALVQVQKRAPDSQVTLESTNSPCTIEAPGNVFDDPMYNMGLDLNSTT